MESNGGNQKARTRAGSGASSRTDDDLEVAQKLRGGRVRSVAVEVKSPRPSDGKTATRLEVVRKISENAAAKKARKRAAKRRKRAPTTDTPSMRKEEKMALGRLRNAIVSAAGSLVSRGKGPNLRGSTRVAMGQHETGDELSAGTPGNEDVDPPSRRSRSTPADRYRDQMEFLRRRKAPK
jgi:hypothetical protein